MLRRPIVPCLVVAMLACQAGPPRERSTRPGSIVECTDGTTRRAMDCQTELGLRERVVAANATLGSAGIGIGGRYEERAKGQVTDSTYQLALRLESLCSEYNACAVDVDGYSAQAEQIRQQLTTHVTLVEGLGGSASAEAGDQIWRNAVPDLAALRLEIDVRIEARPKGSNTTIVHEDGQPLHSGDGMRVVVRSTVPAHVYILLLASNGEPSVLFPDARMGLQNPLPAGSEVAIPNDGTFVLDNVRGDEHIEVLASAQPLADLEQRMAALAGAPAKKPEEGVLGSIGGLLCDEGGRRGIEYRKSSASCDGATQRGIVYRKSGEAPRVAARPNDNVIVYQHRIDHR
jgi:hypothetical protein